MKITARTLLAWPALLCLTLLPLAGQAATTGSGKPATEMRTLAEFQAIQLNGAMDLRVRQGAQQSVEVQADDNLLPVLETVVDSSSQGGRLVVRWKRWQSVNTRSPVKVTVVLPRLTALAAAGSGELRLEAFTTPSLKVSVSGSSDTRLDDLSTDLLDISLAGSGDVRGSGRAAKLAISIAGSGDVALADLRAEEVSVSVAGSGDVVVNANKTLEVAIAGSGDVTYSGNATLKSSVAGSGSVNRR